MLLGMLVKIVSVGHCASGHKTLSKQQSRKQAGPAGKRAVGKHPMLLQWVAAEVA